MTDTANNHDWLYRSFRDYESKIVHYAWSIVGDLETARDIAQDTFLKLCRETPASVGDPPRAWLYKICRHRAIDQYRKNRLRRHESDDRLADYADGDDTAPEQLARRERHAGLLAALAALPEREQEIVRLKYLHDMSYKQIGDTVGLSPSNVGFILHNALVKLRDEIEGNPKTQNPNPKQIPNHKNQIPNKNLRELCVAAMNLFFFRPVTLTGATV